MTYAPNLTQPASHQNFSLRIPTPNNCYSYPSLTAQMPPRLPMLPKSRNPNTYTRSEAIDWANTSRTGKFRFWSDDRQRRAIFVHQSLELWRHQYLTDAAAYANDTVHKTLSYYTGQLHAESSTSRTNSRRRYRDDERAPEDDRSRRRQRQGPTVVPKPSGPPAATEEEAPGVDFNYSDIPTTDNAPDEFSDIDGLA